MARNVKTSVVVLRETENSPRQGHTRCRSSGMGPGGERQNMNAGEERSEAVLSGMHIIAPVCYSTPVWLIPHVKGIAPREREKDGVMR